MGGAFALPAGVDEADRAAVAFRQGGDPVIEILHRIARQLGAQRRVWRLDPDVADARGGFGDDRTGRATR
ncbi:MAG: hypothetical protein AAGE76_00480 [Pseudomonadota bacterium]